jgi:excisionase family DNA binding protein
MAYPQRRFPPFLTVEEATERLHLSSEDVIALTAAGDLRGIQVGNPPRWRIEEASITELLQQLNSAELSEIWRAANAANLPELRRPAAPEG